MSGLVHLVRERPRVGLDSGPLRERVLLEVLLAGAGRTAVSGAPPAPPWQTPEPEPAEDPGCRLLEVAAARVRRRDPWLARLRDAAPAVADRAGPAAAPDVLISDRRELCTRSVQPELPLAGDRLLWAVPFPAGPAWPAVPGALVPTPGEAALLAGLELPRECRLRPGCALPWPSELAPLPQRGGDLGRGHLLLALGDLEPGAADAWAPDWLDWARRLAPLSAGVRVVGDGGGYAVPSSRRHALVRASSLVVAAGRGRYPDLVACEAATLGVPALRVLTVHRAGPTGAAEPAGAAGPGTGAEPAGDRPDLPDWTAGLPADPSGRWFPVLTGASAGWAAALADWLTELGGAR